MLVGITLAPEKCDARYFFKQELQGLSAHCLCWQVALLGSNINNTTDRVLIPRICLHLQKQITRIHATLSRFHLSRTNLAILNCPQHGFSFLIQLFNQSNTTKIAKLTPSDHKENYQNYARSKRWTRLLLQPDLPLCALHGSNPYGTINLRSRPLRTMTLWVELGYRSLERKRGSRARMRCYDSGAVGTHD